ncbi:MAG TPA: uracil-DNA glycosylase [Egibacteraceae bacterium]|nr:uracil-DNA glycosylase [Egibacteraceae bacterium]
MTPTPRAPAIRSWDDLRADALGCTRCRLAQGRTKVVFGVGDPQASLMFVGEAPGFHEDRTGEPFVGRAGQLLDQLCAEVGLSRDAGVYIANVLKCRPPGNRDPQPDEIEACRPYLAEQIAAIDPGVIVTLGAFAMRLLLADVTRGPADPSKIPVGKVAGYRFDYDGRTLIPTYHPAAALRGNDAALSALRRDLRLAAAVVSGRVPTAAEALQAARAATADDSDRPPAASGSAAEPAEAGPKAPPVQAGDLATAQLRLL